MVVKEGIIIPCYISNKCWTSCCTGRNKGGTCPFEALCDLFQQEFWDSPSVLYSSEAESASNKAMLALKCKILPLCTNAICFCSLQN